MGNIYDQLIDAPAATSPAQSTPSKYDDLIESDLNTQRQQFKSTMMTAIGANPQSAAKANRVAKAIGVPFDTAERNTAELENTVKLQEIQRLAAQNPVLAKQLTDPVFAKMSHQDAVNLSGFEGTFKTLWNDVIKPTPVRAWSAYQQGVGGMYQWIGEAAVQPVINAFTSEETRKKYGSSNILTNFGIGLRDDARFVDEYLQKEHPLDPNSWAGASASALQSMYLQAPFMAIGSLAGTARNATATTLGLMGLTTGGQTYGERRERGFSPAASGLSAALDATVEVGTELMPMGTLFDMMKPAAKHSFGRLAGKMVELYGEEMVGESLATLFQDLNDKFMTKPDMTMKERVDQMSQYFSSGEAMQNWINTLKSTAVQTTLMGGAGVGVNRLQQGRLAREQAQHQLLVDALTKAELSQLKSESPDTFAQFAQNTAEHYGAPTIYFQADKLITAAVQQGLTEQQIPEYLAQYGVTESQLQEAVHTGGLIGLETGKFATYFQNDPVLQSLQNDFVIDPNAHSRSESENGVQLDMETMKHLNELYQADQSHKINQDDIAAWEEAILNTPGLKGNVTMDSLMPIIERANLISQATGVPAIEHLNRLLRPTGLQVMKFADYEARKQNKAENITEKPDYGFDVIYDSLVEEGKKTVLKGKGNKGNWSESEFSKHLEQFYPAVHSLYLMHGHNKSQILAALKNAKDGKPLNDNHAAIIQSFKDDMDNYAGQQAEEDDYPFQRDSKIKAIANKIDSFNDGSYTPEDLMEVVELQREWNEFINSLPDGRPLRIKTGFGESLLSRNTTSDNPWRVTRFDKDGQPIGHSEFKNYKDALKEFSDEQSSRAEFLKAVEATSLFQRNFSSHNSRTGNETYSIRKTAAEGMLAPAVLKDGKILAAGIGATHYDVHTEVGQAEGREDANGFVTPDGKFLDRKESLQWLKENRPDVYRALDKETKQNGLESQAYAHAEGLGGDLADEAQRYMESLGLFQTSPFDGKEVATTPLAEGVTEIDVDGVTRPALNSNGKPIHWSEEGIRNFWRWFSGSQVTDEQGRPLVVYRGESETKSLDYGPSEEHGKIYFSDSKKLANVYAGKAENGAVSQAYIKIEFESDGTIEKSSVSIAPNANVYTVSKLENVKSATGNSGAFGKDEPSILFQSAWHGSPHTFDKFSTSAIGTGEGAQAYGYGLYFAGNKEVAEWYKNKLSNSKVFYKGQDYQAISKELPQEAYSALSVVQTYGSIDAAIESIRGRKGETATKIANWLEQNKQDVTFDNAGRLYKVELAPAEDEYLLWDKPLSEQSEKVRDLLFDASRRGEKHLDDTVADILDDIDQGEKVNGGEFYDKLVYVLDENDKAASEYLHSLGIRGIKYLDGNSRGGKQENYNYVIFSDDDVAITEMYQKQQAMNNPLGALNTANGVNIVSLFEGADKSTFLHETAHIFLNDLRYVAETYGVQQKELAAVNEWIKNDPQSLRQHAILIARDAMSKVDAQTAELIKQEIAALEAMPVEQVQYEAFTNRWLAVAGHEKFAEHFEKYLMEGKAPSIELRNAFRSFKRWLTKIYERIESYRKGQRDNVTVSPELAELFGRLMATEQQIQAAREHDALVGMLDANMMADVGDSQSMIDEYRKLLAQSDDSAREKMDKHKLVGSEQRKTEFRKQAQEEVKTIPVYAFVDKVVAEGGINRQSVEAILGKENTPNLPHLWRNDGLDVNVAVAEHGAEHGFNSAGDLAAALQQMKPRQLWVDKRVAQLEAIHDTTLDSQEAIRTAALRRMLEIESEWLAKRAVKQTVTPRATMRAWADKTIAGRTMREINNVGKLLAESRKHRQQAILEARQGKWEEALAANEKARLTEELIAASYRAIKTNKAIESNVNKVKNATRVKSGEAAKVGESWRKQIDRLLDQYGIAKRDYDPAMSNLHDFAASKIDDFDGTGAALPGWIGTEVGDFNKLTFEQRQEFNDALKYLYGNGRDEVRGRKLANGEAVADKAAEIAARQDGIKNKPELMSDATAAGRVIQKVQKNYRKFFANTGILRFIAKRMDGYSKEMGPAEQLVQDIINGMAASNDMWVAIQKEVEPALQILMKDGDKVFSDITWPELLRNEGASWNKARVVAAALNMGNDSNMMKLLDGYGLTQDDASNIASKLTAEEWQAIQKIWDTVDSLWPQIADVHERLKYFRPKKIEARGMTITTADGQQITLKGGYYPIKYDARFTRKIAEWSEKDDLLASHEAIMQVPAAKSGFSKERTGVAYPVDLSLNVLAGHFNDTIRFITLAEKVRDADRVFRNDTLMTRNLETMGRDMVDMIRPTLKQVIRPEASKVSPWFERSRVAMSMYYMGYNAWTAIQNITGVFPAIKQAGAANYMNGIMHVIANPLAAHKAMLEASSYMRLRSANVERDMKKQLREFNIGGMEINGKRYTYDDVKSLGFAGIRLLDGVVALPAWWGKYNAEMEQHGDVKKATEAADAAINNALGSGLAIDSTGFQRHPFLSLLAPFMSFASTQQEVLATERQAWKEGKIGNSEFLYGHLMTWVAPAVMSTFLQGMLMYGIMGAIGGGDDDKKKKDWSDYIGDLISYRLMGIPFLRDVFNGVKQGFDNKAPVTSARMPVTEGFKMVQQLGYRVGNLDGSEKKTKAAMWSAAELASLASGVPATRIYDRWQKGTKQIENGTGWWGNHFVPQEKKK